MHKQAIEDITLLQTTRDVGELLLSVHAAEKRKNQQSLITIAENIRFLARQGLALCRDGDRVASNFTQLLQLRAIDQPQLLTWMERKTDKYTCPQVQNEILTVMACTVLRHKSALLQNAAYYCLMADEVTNSSNKKQVVAGFRCVDEKFEVQEEFVGLYHVESIKSNAIVLKDTILRLNLAISNCRGQCYDGAANMPHIWNDVAAQICHDFLASLFFKYHYMTSHRQNMSWYEAVLLLNILLYCANLHQQYC